MADDERIYCIVRMYSPSLAARQVIDVDLTLDEAQAHCNDPSTREAGVWFDGWTEMENHPELVEEYRLENE